MEVNQKTEKRKINIILIKLYLSLFFNFLKLVWVVYLLIMLITFTVNGKIIKIIDIENPNDSVIIIWNGLLNIF